MTRRTSKSLKSPANGRTAGGSAAAGGFTFQADATALAIAHMVRGARLNWLEGLVDDTPVAIEAETGGPGDDIRITLREAATVEVQVKRGLRRDARLWGALDALAHGLRAGIIDYGVIAVSPDSSGTITHDLARDLQHLGDGRRDGLSAIGREWLDRLELVGHPPEAICAALRIVVIDAVAGARQSVSAATLLLMGLLVEPDQASDAWQVLARDALSLIEHRGRRTVESSLRVLSAAGIATTTNIQAGGAAAIVRRLCEWTADTNAVFTVIGVERPISIDRGWLTQYAAIMTDAVPPTVSFAEALAHYHGEGDQTSTAEATNAHAATIGRFFKRCVVMAGPGVGKSTLVRKLARSYALDGFPVLQVRLRTLLERMRATGCGFGEGLFALALDKSGVSPERARAAGIREWVVLFDGLDECGPDRSQMAREIADFSAGHPECRVVVTSRPIGYVPGHLATWRHYSLLDLGKDDLERHARSILSGIVAEEVLSEAVTSVVSALQRSPALPVIVRKPLLLALAIALALRNGSVGDSISDIYAQMFRLVQDAAAGRASTGAIAENLLGRVIDILGFDLVTRSPEAAAVSLGRAATVLAADLAVPRLAASAQVEAALDYWCDVGMLERVHHGSTELLTFVHKTFGEFAAARYIAEGDPPVRATLLRTAVLANADPVLEFSASLGLAVDALDVLVECATVPLSVETIVRALGIAASSFPAPTDAALEPVIARAFELLLGAGRRVVDKLGMLLVALCPTYSGLLYRHAEPRLDYEDIGVALVAWNCALACGLSANSTEKLADAIERFSVADDVPSSGTITGRYVIDRDRESMFPAFAHNAINAVVAIGSASHDQLLLTLLRHPQLNSFGFASAAEAAFSAAGRRDLSAAMREYWMGEAKGYPDNSLIDFDDYEEAARTFENRMLRALAGTAEPSSALVNDLSRIMTSLSGFLSVSDWGSTPGADVWNWRDQTWGPIEKTIFSATARLTGIDPEALAMEAASSLAEIKNYKGFHIFTSANRTVPVDIEAIAWSGAQALGLDVSTLERALYHPSHYLVSLAVSLVDAVVMPDQRQAIVARLYRDGTGLALSAGASLCKNLPQNQAFARTIERLGGKLIDGIEDLFEVFEPVPPEPTEQVIDVLHHCLMGPQRRPATEAAALIARMSEPPASVRKLLEAAFDHWAEQPDKPNTPQPPSPCDTIVTSLLTHFVLSDVELLRVFKRAHGGGSSAPRLVRERWSDDSAFRDQIFDQALGGGLLPNALATIFSVPALLTDSQVEHGMTLLKGCEPTRWAAVPLLGLPDFPQDRVDTVLPSLLRDESPRVRSQARRAIEARELAVVEIGSAGNDGSDDRPPEAGRADNG